MCSTAIYILRNSQRSISVFNTAKPIIVGNLYSQSKRFAGHSHWQNVRQTKEAKDKEKSKLAQFYLRAVANAIKVGKGIRDPRLNSYLATVLAEAKAQSVPFSTLERVIKADVITDPYLVEAQAQGGLFILIESCANPVNSERQKIASLVKRYGCSVVQSPGRIASEFFDHIGTVTITSDSKLSNLDDAMTLGIEVGAHDVQQDRADGVDVFRFLCDPASVDIVRKSLEEEHEHKVQTAEDVYVPKLRVQVKPEAYANLSELYEKIRDQHECVDRIFDNVTVVNDQKS